MLEGDACWFFANLAFCCVEARRITTCFLLSRDITWYAETEIFHFFELGSHNFVLSMHPPPLQVLPLGSRWRLVPAQAGTWRHLLEGRDLPPSEFLPPSDTRLPRGAIRPVLLPRSGRRRVLPPRSGLRSVNLPLQHRRGLAILPPVFCLCPSWWHHHWRQQRTKRQSLHRLCK